MRLVEGVVSSVIGDLATIEITVAEGGCGRCHEVGGCGGKNISRALCSKTHFLAVKNSLRASVGDVVSIGLEEESISGIATRAYVIPLAGLITGSALGEFLIDSAGPTPSILGAIAGFALAVSVIRFVFPREFPLPRMVGQKRTSSCDPI